MDELTNGGTVRGKDGMTGSGSMCMMATQLQDLRKQAYLKRFLSLCCKPGWYAAWCPAQDGVARESLRPLAKSFSTAIRKMTRSAGACTTAKLGKEVLFLRCPGGQWINDPLSNRWTMDSGGPSWRHPGPSWAALGPTAAVLDGSLVPLGRLGRFFC